jgi:uncharacterized protein YeaO (DUF488 family)
VSQSLLETPHARTKLHPMSIALKRVYDDKSPDDGFRVLIDRLWPRGLDKASAGIDLWVKDAAPSTELRRWFGHDPEKWQEFQRRYRDELGHNDTALATLRDLAKGHKKLTLLYAAKDTAHNNAVVLKDVLAH